MKASTYIWMNFWRCLVVQNGCLFMLGFAGAMLGIGQIPMSFIVFVNLASFAAGLYWAFLAVKQKGA